MKSNVLFGVAGAALLALSASGASATTLDDVKARGVLKCGVNTGLAGFAAPNDKGEYSGFDVDYCKAIAAAIFDDPSKVEYTGTSAKDRFEVLANGTVDVLVRNTTWTLSRDTSLGFNFAGVNYYDGQGFMINTKKVPGVNSALQLSGAAVCVQTGTTTELNLADYFRANKIKYTPVPIEDSSEARKNYLADRCDAYTTDASGLAATRATFEKPSDHVILPEIISKEPLGPVVRHGDNQWEDIVRWAVFALIQAEESGVTAANADAMAKTPPNPDVARLLGAEGDLGAMLGLDKAWALRAIKAHGNYGEIFESNLGTKTPIGLERGLNAQYTNGGLQYAPPFR